MSDFIRKLSPQEVLAARTRLGKTQRELAYDVGVTERTYRRWERETGAPSMGTKLIQRMLDVAA